jgi:hypothetical protein
MTVSFRGVLISLKGGTAAKESKNMEQCIPFLWIYFEEVMRVTSPGGEGAQREHIRNPPSISPGSTTLRECISSLQIRGRIGLRLVFSGYPYYDRLHILVNSGTGFLKYREICCFMANEVQFFGENER